jgi:hypothetical protein
MGKEVARNYTIDRKILVPEEGGVEYSNHLS